MKRSWLIVVLACSLSLNIGIIANFAYWRYGGQVPLGLKPASPLPFQELWRSLDLEPEQRQIVRGLLPAHRQRIDELRLRLAQQRQELSEMLKGEAPSWPAMKDKIREIAELQGSLELEIVRFGLDFRDCLKPEQKISFMKFMERRLLSLQGGSSLGHGLRSLRGRSGRGTGSQN